MHILYIYTDYFQNYDILWTLLQMEISVDVIDHSFFTYESDSRLIEMFSDKLSASHYDFVLSFGYVPYISDICTRLHVPYAAWTYDSILHSLYNKTVENPYNILFVFDRAEYDYLKRHFAIPNLFHLPLAANTDRIQAIPVTPSDPDYYGCDISFAGDLYQQNTYVDLKPELSPEEQNFFEQAFTYFEGKWNHEQIFQWFSREDADYLQNRLPDYLKNTESMPNTRCFADILLSKPIASRERIHILNMLADAFDMRLYTKNSADISILNNVSCYPGVNYYDALSKVYFYSRINLNITLHSIVSGIPLRCFDVLGAGGFLLTNYQEELCEYFKPDRELVIYHDYDELSEKAAYFLAHEDERRRIACAGLAAIKNNHTYRHRLQSILDTVSRII